MDPKELKALLQKAVDLGNEVKLKNVELETQATAHEKTVGELVTSFEALQKQIKDGGGDKKELLKMADQIDEAMNEISDLRSKVKSPASAITDESQKKAVKSVLMESVGAFVKSKSNTDVFEFVENHATAKLKTLNISSPETGGLAIAETLSRDVLDYYRDMSPILSEIGRNTGMTRSYRQMVLISYPSVIEGIENVAGTSIAETSTQTYAELKSKEFKLTAQPRITNEALYGTDINVYSDLVRLLGDEIGIYLSNQVLFGDGQDKNARGILSSNRFDATNTTGESWKPTLGAGRRDVDYYPAYATGVSGAMGTDDKSKTDWLLTFMRKLPKRYRSMAKLYMNENTLLEIELLRDANNKPVFEITYRDTGEPVIKGKTIVIDDTLPDIAADSAFIIYGDLKEAFVINEGDIDQMILDQVTSKGSLIVYTEKEFFEMAQRSDAILIGCATTNGL